MIERSKTSFYCLNQLKIIEKLKRNEVNNWRGSEKVSKKVRFRKCEISVNIKNQGWLPFACFGMKNIDSSVQLCADSQNKPSEEIIYHH